MWSEVEIVKKDNKRELSLTGGSVSERIKEDGLDSHIFTLTFVNYLHISDTCLETLPDDISNLTNLQKLMLHSNKLTSLPAAIQKLEKLKLLDVSCNNLTEVPVEVTSLPNLDTLNLSSNNITTFPSLKDAVKIAVLDLSNNSLKEFPNICHKSLTNLSEIKLSGNKIESISHDIAALSAIKVLHLSNNMIKKVPKALANLNKVKDLNMKDNLIEDRRLLKLVQQNAKIKQIMDYVKQNGTDAPAPVVPDDKASERDGSSTGNAVPLEPLVTQTNPNKIRIIRSTDGSIKVKYLEAVRAVRPHILCCVAMNINFNDDKLKDFLRAQTELHDDVCKKREASTIATHDLAKINKDGDLFYTAMDPNHLFFTPLKSNKQTTAKFYYDKLRTEAENQRKEKKRNMLNGIHKYLYLLDNKDKYACMTTGTEEVISVPPLTNSEISKMTPETKSLLFEVTSNVSLKECKAAMESLILETLKLGLGDDVNFKEHILIIQQVRVVDEDGNLKNVYPSKTDLNLPESMNIVVQRDN